ncbi:putative cell surface protein [Clostridium sp. CAG:451]|nr:putative cell surface protein [Clostridium sp. CAG:451]
MKKISYLIFILIAFIVLIPRVDAKEIDISNLEFYKEIEVEAGDKIIYDGNKVDGKFLLTKIYYHSNVKEEYYKEEHVSSYTYTFSIPSYYQLLNDDMQIPANKKVKITLSIGSYCGVLIEIFLHYSLVDDVKKNVIYNNTLDAVNDNVESYYEGEADILLKDIKREGYKFLGWYTTSDYKEDSRITVIDKDAPETLELYAKWEKIESQVKKDNIDENPNTYTTTYVIAGIFIILMLSTVIVYVYGKKYNI